MQIVRTIVWVLLLFALLAFSFFNWTPVEVRIWSNLVLETKLPALVIVAFLLGLVPMWLVHMATKIRMRRRFNALESATSRMASATPPNTAASSANQAPAAATTTDTPARPVRPAPAPASTPTTPAEPANPVDPEPTKPA